jgi:hypothetical protein
MRSYRSAILIATFGIPVLFGVWLLFLLFGSGELSNAPGYPFSIIIPGTGLILVNLAWSIKSLLSEVGAQRIPRILSVIAASLLGIGMLLVFRDILAPVHDQTTSLAISIPLLFSAFFLSQVTSLVASGGGKTNLRAWLRVIGAACIGAILLFSLLFIWSTW